MYSQNLVTIAIPAYKRHWLSEAIESALNQDYQNIELLIVDDHSPQNLKEVVEPYLKDSRVHYYYNEKNLGKESIVLNWNRCLDLAHGEFFVLLCDDDILEPNFVSTLLRLAEKYPECEVFHGRCQRLNERENTIEIDVCWNEYESYEEFLNNDKAGLRRHTVTEFLYKTKMIKEIRYYVTPLGWGADEVSLFRFIMGNGVCSSSDPVVSWRLTNEHLSCPGTHCFEKAKARLLTNTWYYNNIPSKFSYNSYRDITDNDVFFEFERAGLIDRFKILYIVPFEIWGLKQKIYLSYLTIKKYVFFYCNHKL